MAVWLGMSESVRSTHICEAPDVKCEACAADTVLSSTDRDGPKHCMIQFWRLVLFIHGVKQL